MALRSKARAVWEIEASSGGLRTGVAISPASTNPAKPATASPQTTSLRPPESILAIMTPPLSRNWQSNYRELCITELRYLQLPICGTDRNPYLAPKLEKPDSIVRDDRN